MDKGTYKGRPVNFSKYEVSLFTPYLFSSKLSIGMGCGACAVSLLTGIAPALVDANNSNSLHYSDKFVVNFLRRLGFSVLGLTQSNVTARQSAIGYHHVILLSQLVRRDEATWGVVYDGKYYHNFDIYHLDSLSLLNKPILSAYLVVQHKWRLQRPEKPNAKRKVSGLTPAAIGLPGPKR